MISKDEKAIVRESQRDTSLTSHLVGVGINQKQLTTVELIVANLKLCFCIFQYSWPHLLSSISFRNR